MGVVLGFRLDCDRGCHVGVHVDFGVGLSAHLRFEVDAGSDYDFGFGADY